MGGKEGLSNGVGFNRSRGESLLDQEIEAEFCEALDFLSRLPTSLALRRIRKSMREVNKVEPLGKKVTTKLRQNFVSFISDGDLSARDRLISDAKSPDDLTFEVASKAADASPWLRDLVLVHGETFYSHVTYDKRLQRRFFQQRRFLIEPLDQVPQGEIEDYLKQFIANIEFRNKVFKSLSLHARQEALIFILKDHSIWGNSFTSIRQKLFQRPFSFSSHHFPDESTLGHYYGALLFALQEKFPKLARKYSLELEKKSIDYGKAALRRLKEDALQRRAAEEAELRKSLERALSLASPADRMFYENVLSGRLRQALEKEGILYEFWKGLFPTLAWEGPLPLWRIQNWLGSDRGHLPEKGANRIFKLLQFTKNRTLVPTEKTAFETFLELLEQSDKPIPKEVLEDVDMNRVGFLRLFKKTFGVERVKIALYALPSMSIPEILKLIEELIIEGITRSKIKRATAQTHVKAGATIMTDIVSGRDFDELLFKKKIHRH